MDPRVEELLRNAREASRIDRGRIELFEGLVRTKAWECYVELLNAKIQMLADQVLAPAGSIDALVGMEYVKGAMSGLIIARDITSVTIAAKPDLRPIAPVLDDEELNDDTDELHRAP